MYCWPLLASAQVHNEPPFARQVQKLEQEVGSFRHPLRAHVEDPDRTEGKEYWKGQKRDKERLSGGAGVGYNIGNIDYGADFFIF
jgi:hypothetical protein